MVNVEESARAAIRAAVHERGWSLAQCVEQLEAVNYKTNRPTVQRFMRDDTRRLGLDEFAAWAAALSLPPLDLLSPVAEKSRERARALAVREWLTGREPLDVVPEPDRYRAAVLGHASRPSNFAAMLRALAHEYDAADDAGQQDIALTVADTATGTLRALLRHRGRKTTSRTRVDREQEG